MSALSELRQRIEAATGSDRGLDGRIAWALGWRFSGFVWDGDQVGGPDTVADFDTWPEMAGSWKQPGDDYFFGDSGLSNQELRLGGASGRWTDPPKWTASIDAALALVERVLPGWYWRVDRWKSKSDDWVYSAMLGEYLDRSVAGLARQVGADAATSSLAILSALLTALDLEPPHGR